MEKLWKKVAMINILEMLPYEMIDVVPGELGAVLLGLGPLAVVLNLSHLKCGRFDHFEHQAK